MTRKKKMEAPGDDFCRKMGDFSDVAPFGDESFYCLDDLLDFPGLGDGEIDACPIEDPPNANLTVSDCAPAAPPAPDSSTVTEDNCPVLCVPQDDLGDLEWLPFVNSSFSTEPPKPFLGPKMAESEGDQREPSKLSLCNPKPAVSPLNPATGTRSSPPFIPNSPLPCRARSKRSRTPACNWSSRIVSPTSSVTSFEHCHSTSAVSSDSDYFAESSVGNKKRKGNGGHQGGVMRKCSHCETTKTPQWRTGPKGPKTLCNACGVRYKSGRLVPEYRPAASPTFSPSIHSNSHRRVMEMRRNKQLGVLKGGASLFRGKVLAKQASPVSESEYSLCGFGCEEGEDSCLLPIKQDYRHFI